MLPGRWRAELKMYSTWLNLDLVSDPIDGVEPRVFIRQSRRSRSMVEIFGSWPEGYCVYEGADSRGREIYVTPSRPARDLAADIARRFLAGYMQRLKKAIKTPK